MSILDRLYHDYLMPGRWVEYHGLLTTALDLNYQFTRIRDLGTPKDTGGRIFFLRHDIDSDLPLARKMFEIEKELGIRSTYYFRNSTIDPTFMKEVSAFGSEVGYHYEEIADHIKANGLCTRDQVLTDMEAIREKFLANLRRFEGSLGEKIVTAASHGDFANRALGIANHVILDQKTRQIGGLEMEAYDKALEGNLDFRASDVFYPKFWRPSPPQVALEQGVQRVLVLVHPRQWGSAPLQRAYLDLSRIVDGMLFKIKQLQ